MIIKDPSSEITYHVNWTSWLGSDTIATSTWTVPADLTTLGSPTKTNTHAYIKLGGGVRGETYEVVNTIVTAAGEKEDATIVLYIKDK